MSDVSATSSSAEKGTLVTLDVVEHDSELLAYMEMGDAYLGSIGYTEHGMRHANLTAHIAGNILRRLGYDARTAEVASIAGFMHDIGNCVSRSDHWISSAFIARDVLSRLGMDFAEIAMIMNAVGNHEEDASDPSTPVAAAVVIADKADVHETRVRNMDATAYDIHDRVNHSAKRSFLRVDSDARVLALELAIDLTEIQIIDYFEIFLERMQLCRRAATVLDARFSLVINGTKLL
jgi:uncharacterized protein